MDELKKQAVQRYYEKQKEQAKDEFQNEVEDILSEIECLTENLENAKKRLFEVKYKEPKELDENLLDSE